MLSCGVAVMPSARKSNNSVNRLFFISVLCFICFFIFLSSPYPEDKENNKCCQQQQPPEAAAPFTLYCVRCCFIIRGGRCYHIIIGGGCQSCRIRITGSGISQSAFNGCPGGRSHRQFFIKGLLSTHTTGAGHPYCR